MSCVEQSVKDFNSRRTDCFNGHPDVERAAGQELHHGDDTGARTVQLISDRVPRARPCCQFVIGVAVDLIWRQEFWLERGLHVSTWTHYSQVDLAHRGVQVAKE